MLALAVCAMLLTLAYPLKEYLGQRSQISQARADGKDLQAQVDALTKEHKANQTPAQIEAQARARLHYTVPGQQNYIVIGPKASTAPTVTKPGHAKVPIDPDATWYERLWASDVTAGKG